MGSAIRGRSYATVLQVQVSHYAAVGLLRLARPSVRPSVRPSACLSVCPSVPYGLVTQKQKNRKNKRTI